MIWIKKLEWKFFFFLKDAFILVNKSLLILLADDTKKLANTGNNRVVNSKHELIIQSNLKYLGSRKQEKLEFHECPWMHQEQGIRDLSTEPGEQWFRIEIMDCCWLLWTKFWGSHYFLLQGNYCCSIWVKMSLKLALFYTNK